VFVESCDDFIAQENKDLMCEVKRLKEEVTKLKGKGQVRPSQDNRDPVVKKLEMGSNFTSSAHQQGQKSIKYKIPRKKTLEHIKCFKCLEKGHYARYCQIKSDEEAQLSRNQKKLPENRMDARNWGIWFTAVHSSSDLTIPIRPVIPDRSDRSRPV